MSDKQSKFGLFFISNENSLQPCTQLTGKQFYCVGSQSDAFFVSTTEGTYSVQSQDNIELFWNESLCQISDGKGFNIGLGLNNRLYSWGFEGEVGQLGQGAAFRKIFEPLEIKNTVDMISISTGESFSISLDEKGHAYSWGENFDKQLALYTKPKTSMHLQNAMIEEMTFNPKLIPLTMKVPLSKVACGLRFTLAITKTGKLLSWGAGDCGQLGTGRCTFKELPSEINFSNENDTIVKSIACGDGHSLAVLSNGNLYSWGLNYRGQCGLNHTQAEHFPTLVENIRNVDKVYALGHSSACIDSFGDLWTWGSTDNEKLLLPLEYLPETEETPKIIKTKYYSQPTRVYSSFLDGCIVDSFLFSKTKSAIFLKTTLTDLNPKTGPRKSFQKIIIKGYGLWDSPNIIVKFSSKVESVYNPPRSSIGKFEGPDTIFCKPPKFSDTGLYYVTVSMNGGQDFLPQQFELMIYKEIPIIEQYPTVIDLRQPTIPKFLLKMGSSFQDASGITEVLVRLQFIRNSSDNTNKSLKTRRSDLGSQMAEKQIVATGKVYSLGDLIKKNNILLSNYDFPSDEKEDIEDKPLTHTLESELFATTPIGTNLINNSNPEETQNYFFIECEDLDIHELQLSSGFLYDLQVQVSFNEQDYYGSSSKEPVSSLGHSFHPFEATPSCFALRKLFDDHSQDSMDEHNLSNKTVSNQAEGLKLTLFGESLIPLVKLPRESSIQAVLALVKIQAILNSNSKEIELKKEILEGRVEHLLVTSESFNTMSMNLNSEFLRELKDTLRNILDEEKSHHNSDFDDLHHCLLTLEFEFQLHLPYTNDPIRMTYQQDKCLLCPEHIPIFFYPDTNLEIHPSLMRKTSPLATLSVQPIGGKGFIFKPSFPVIKLTPNLPHLEEGSSLQLHSLLIKGKDVQIVPIYEELVTTEVIADADQAPNNEENNEGTNNEFENIEEMIAHEEPRKILGYKLDTELTNFEDLLGKCMDLNATGEHHFSVNSFNISVSLDGDSFPTTAYDALLQYYSVLTNYTLHTSPPKGGFVGGANIVLILDQHLPMTSKIIVRLRGSDPEKTTKVQGILSEHHSAANTHPSISLGFQLPDAGTLATVPPVVNGKEKLYHIDLSLDNGDTFDLAASPILQVK